MADRRRDKRTRRAALTCNRGRVIDLSTRGMRLSTRRPWPERTQRRVILRHDGRCVTVWAECVWRRRESGLRHTVGLAFVNPSDEAAMLIGRAVNTAGDPLPMLIPLGQTPATAPGGM